MKTKKRALVLKAFAVLSRPPFVPLLLISKHTRKLLNFFFFCLFLAKRAKSFVAPDVTWLPSSNPDLTF